MRDAYAQEIELEGKFLHHVGHYELDQKIWKNVKDKLLLWLFFVYLCLVVLPSRVDASG